MIRVRFSIRELLVGIAVLATGFATLARYSTIEQRFADAQIRYDAAVAKYEVGMRQIMDICAESFVLYAAEHERWFRSGGAWKNQVDRLRHWEKLANPKAAVTMLSNETNVIRAQQIADDIRTMREQFECSDH